MEKIVTFEAENVLEGFYKAGEHLAEHVHTVGGERATSFTTKELNAGGKKRVNTEPDDLTVEYIYRVIAKTGTYQSGQGALWGIIASLEKVFGMSSKRKAFVIKKSVEIHNTNDVMATISFDMDKEIPKMKKCLTDDEYRPTMMYPAIETATGIMIATNGHILVAHKLQGYDGDKQGGLPALFAGLLNVPREVLKMKGRVTIVVTENPDEENGVIVTATDEHGCQGVVEQRGRFPNWRSVVPKEIGPDINIDTKAFAKSIKCISSQLSKASMKMTMEAKASDESLRLYGEDIDFSTGGDTKVEVTGGVPSSMKMAVKATALLVIINFNVNTMHYIDASSALIFKGAGTFAMMMPLQEEWMHEAPRTPDNQMQTFDVDECMRAAGAESKVKGQKSKPAAGAGPKDEGRRMKVKPETRNLKPETKSGASDSDVLIENLCKALRGLAA